MYLSVKMISVVMTYTGYKVNTNVVTLHIIHSAVVDRKVVGGAKSACGFRSIDTKFVRHLGGDWFIISYDNRPPIWTTLLLHSIKIISTCSQIVVWTRRRTRMPSSMGEVSYCR